MEKRKSTGTNFNLKKKKTEKFIDIRYSEFDSDPDSEDDPEWLPENHNLKSFNRKNVESESEESESEDFSSIKSSTT